MSLAVPISSSATRQTDVKHKRSKAPRPIQDGDESIADHEALSEWQ